MHLAENETAAPGLDPGVHLCAKHATARFRTVLIAV
jgi:hypothetical protein